MKTFNIGKLEVSFSWKSSWKKVANTGMFISAIKEHRHCCASSLKEAKEAVEKYMAEKGITKVYTA